MDIRINLIALCHSCHRKFHDGHEKRDTFLEIVAKREKTTVAVIVEVTDLFRHLLKPTDEELLEGLAGLSPKARELAERELTECGRMPK